MYRFLAVGEGLEEYTWQIASVESSQEYIVETYENIAKLTKKYFMVFLSQ